MKTSTAHHVMWLAQADLMILVAKMLAPPSQEQRDYLAIDDSDLCALAASAGLESDSEASKALRAALQEASRTSDDAWADEHVRLFEGAAACPLG